MEETTQQDDEFSQKSTRPFDISSIAQYHYYLSQSDKHQHLDQRVVNDLNLNNCFTFIDRTSSSIGQQYLYNRILSLDPFRENFKQLEEDIAFYHEDKNKAEKSKGVLEKLTKDTDYFFPYLIFAELPEKINYLILIKALQLLVFVLIGVTIFYHVFIFPLLLVLTINMCIHYVHKKKIGKFIQYFFRLNTLTKTCRKLIPLSTNPEDEIIQKVIEVEKLSTSISFLKTDELQNSEIGSIIWLVIELLKVATLSEITLFYKIIDHITNKRADIHELYKFIGYIDFTISINQLRINLPYYCKPIFDPNKKILTFKELYHPLLKGCVSNDLTLEEKSLMLTGSNMSGKSTFIKSIGINVITAQTLNTSFTKEYIASPFQVSSSMKISDDINENKSYYLEEVITIGEMLEKSEDKNERHLFIIDEIFKGTNTVERISGAKAILSHLNKGNHLVLLATHDIELTTLLEQEYDLYYFQEEVDDERLAFDYKIKKGRIKNFNALKILEISGYPKSIVAEAKELAEKMEQQGKSLQ